MSLHPEFPILPYAPLIPKQRWFPADEALHSTAYAFEQHKAKAFAAIAARFREYKS